VAVMLVGFAAFAIINLTKMHKMQLDRYDMEITRHNREERIVNKFKE